MNFVCGFRCQHDYLFTTRAVFVSNIYMYVSLYESLYHILKTKSIVKPRKTHITLLCLTPMLHTGP